MKYAIGLDIGISSVGWATLALNEKEEPMRIISMGSRIFDAAEATDGASLAAPRREARGVRRRLARHRFRLTRIRNLIVANGLLSADELAHIFDGQLGDIYALRARALEQKISEAELARVLLHLAQRRGFRSNRKADSKDKEAGALLTAVANNRARMQSGAYRTVGEMMAKDAAFAACKRNKSANYLSTVSRDMIEDEAKQIFAAQRKCGAAYATTGLEIAYLEILLAQRAFDEGPGAPSPYGGDQIFKMVGICTLQRTPPEKRAAKACYSFEYFTLLQKVNHMRILQNGESLPLSKAQREALISLAHKSPTITYAKLRKELAIADNALFADVRYRGTEHDEAEAKEKFVCLKAYHAMRTALDKVYKGRITKLSRAMLNEAGNIFTLYKTDAKIIAALKAANFAPEDIDALLTLGGFAKFGHLSLLACDKLIPHLEAGKNYNEACEAAGYDFKAHNSGGERATLLSAKALETESLTSPVVRRAIAQTIKVINAIIRNMGESPVYVNIELAREMAKDFNERKKLDKDMRENAAQNDRIMERIRTEFGKINATGLDLVKLKLYEEQGGICMYSQKPLQIEHLFDPGYAEIDHIVPYSISFDDTYKNKVLVLAEENRQKGNRLPMQYLQGKRQDDFVVWVNNTVRNFKKRQRLLKAKLTDEDLSGFKERNLQDTKTMARFMYNYITDHLAFAPSSTGKKKRVTAVNGNITSMLRKRYGIAKLRADGDLHHAVDAVLIACTTDGMIRTLSQYSERQESAYVQNEAGAYAVHPKTGEIKKRIPYPWPQFRTELELRLSANPAELLCEAHLPNYTQADIDAVNPIFVSRMPRHKITGAAHKATIKSLKAIEDELLLVKKPLTSLTFDKDGELANYYRPERDTILYSALKARLSAFGGDAKKAFAEPFYKPKSGSLVKRVQLYEKATVYVPVHGGKAAADNDSMVRADVFYIEGDGYYLVPIYVADTVKPILPNKAVVAHKPFSEWKEMHDSDFLFSLYANDLIYVEFNESKEFSIVQKESSLPAKCSFSEGYLYYSGMNISTGSLGVFTHDHTYNIAGLGVKTLPKLQKCVVDVLGNISFVKKEKRQCFNQKKNISNKSVPK